MIRNIYRRVKKSARNLFYKAKQQEEAKDFSHQPAPKRVSKHCNQTHQLSTNHPNKRPKYGRLSLGKSAKLGMRYRHTNPKEAA